MRKDWEYKKLGEVCTIERGGSPRPITDFITNDSNGINWIKIGDTKEGSKYITSTKEKIKPEGVKKSRFVHKGDFILSNSMSFGRPYILDIDGCIHDGWLVIHDGKKFFSKDYLYYLLASPIMYSRFSQLAVGGVVNNLNSALVRKVIVPIPPISIQLSIANELDKINELIQLKKQQLKDYDQLAQSIFYEMFGDPVENEKGWEVKKLGEICSKIGSGATPKGGNNSYKDTGISLIRSLNVHNNLFKYEDLAHIDDSQATALNNVIVKEKDILLNITGASVARCCIVPNDVLPARVNQHVCIIRIANESDSFYLNRLFTNDSYQSKLLALSKSKAATREALPKTIVESLSVPLPPLPLQQQFAARIEAIERQKQQVSETIKDLETLLASRMQYWFD